MVTLVAFDLLSWISGSTEQHLFSHQLLGESQCVYCKLAARLFSDHRHGKVRPIAHWDSN